MSADSKREFDWQQLQPGNLTRADTVAQRLERMILSNQLVAGDRLPPEREFAEQLGVSRNSLREALRSLELQGLLERKQGRGTTVRAVADTELAVSLASGLDHEKRDLQSVMEVRACIEPPVASLAAERATPVDIDQLNQLVQEMRLVTDPIIFAGLDRVFHRAIAQYTYNPMLVRLLDKVAEIIDVSRRELFLSRARLKSSLQEHVSIVHAIEARDPAGAFEAARLHVRSVQSRVLSLGETHTERD